MTHLRLVPPPQARVPSPRARAAAVRRRADLRWDTALGRFVDQITVVGLVRQLHQQGIEVTKYSVYQWLSGSVSPRFYHAIALVAISNGSLSLADVYGHRQELMPELRPAA